MPGRADPPCRVSSAGCDKALPYLHCPKQKAEVEERAISALHLIIKVDRRDLSGFPNILQGSCVTQELIHMQDEELCAHIQQQSCLVCNY